MLHVSMSRQDSNNNQQHERGGEGRRGEERRGEERRKRGGSEDQFSPTGTAAPHTVTDTETEFYSEGGIS